MRCFLALMLLLFALPADAAVTFTYHRFGEDTYPSTNVRMAQFEAQLDFLEQEGFDVWPLPKLATHLRDGEAVPDKVVVITIDDAYESVYTRAYPALAKRGFPFTVFVASNPVDQEIAGYMSWAQLRELHAAGVTLANHSATHDYLLRRRVSETQAQWRERVRADIENGQRRLQAEIGVDLNENPKLFAYPFGEYDDELAHIAAELGYLAFGQHSGAVGANADLRALPRFPVNERHGALDDFALKARSLPLPVVEVEPWNPRVADRRAPAMTLTLLGSGADLDRLNCYFGSERMKVQRRGELTFRISTEHALPRGRSRYNCTAPDKSSGRWYWYSHLWVASED